MIKVGVTGSNGFIGWHLCNTLLLNPVKYELIHFNRDWFDNNVNLDSFVKKCDIIVHLAGLNRHSKDDVIYNTNLILAQKLIDSFYRTNFKGQVLFSSSSQEARNNVFGNSKKAARELFSAWAIDTGAKFQGLIIPNVFGAFAIPFYNSVISTFCYQLVNNQSPIIENDTTLNLIYINDLINIIIELFINESKDIINITHTDTFKVSEILDFLNHYKSKYLLHGQIPNLKSRFEINLFNTFRSYFNLKEHFPIKYKNNIDNRGNFVEIMRVEIGGQVSFSSTKSGIIRGNHFHTKKIERFSVIKGKALIKLRKKGTEEVIQYHLNGDTPAYVDMPIWYVHNIENIGNDELYTIFWSNELYDANDPDTFFEIV